MELSAFVKSLRPLFSQWKSSSKRVLDVVIGNQVGLNPSLKWKASDADSIVSSIVYSYMLEAVSLQSDVDEKRNRDENRHYVPLLYISDEKLRFRSEIRVLFQMANIDMSSLLTIQSCMKELQDGNGRLHFHLVDHNVLSPELDCFESVETISCSNS
jgi:hypothetical protein